MNTVCDENKCTSCMACINICPKNAITICDNLTSNNAIIDNKICIKCNMCYKICQANFPIARKNPKQWYQGWSADSCERLNASSGGIASAISSAFIKSGGYVSSCVFENGEFIFKTTNNIGDIKCFTGSKYVKSNPYNAYTQIQSILKVGGKVLFIALPCQVAGILKYVKHEFQKNLYTIDLICHGTPSPKLLEIYLKQHHINIKQLNNIQFRKKTEFHLSDSIQTVEKKGACDAYSLAFLNAVSYTTNCYHCQYANMERISDITIGDSWGSSLPKVEIDKGVSLILIQSTKGRSLLHASNIHLEEVDLENAVQHNHQLSAPSTMNATRDFFFNNLGEGHSFNRTIAICLPKTYFKQRIKEVLYPFKKSLGGKNIIDYCIVVSNKSVYFDIRDE